VLARGIVDCGEPLLDARELCRIEIDSLPATSPGKLHWLLTAKQLRLLA